MSKLRNCCFTVNNFTEEQYDSICKIKCKYLVCAKEIGDEGTPHLQGFVEFDNPMGFKSLTKKFFKGHLEPRKASDPRVSAGYCKKGKSESTNYLQFFKEPDATAIFFEKGTISFQGKRSDIDAVVELIQDGNSMSEVARVHPASYVKFHKGFKALAVALVEKRNEVPKVQVFYGATGTGKSYSARNIFKENGYYLWTPARGKWWDHYEGQKNIIIEEFTGQLPYRYMLSLLDRYDCPIEYKGGTCEFVGVNIIITSPKHPSAWYARDECTELLRRISDVQLFDKVYKMEQK